MKLLYWYVKKTFLWDKNKYCLFLKSRFGVSRWNKVKHELKSKSKRWLKAVMRRERESRVLRGSLVAAYHRIIINIWTADYWTSLLAAGEPFDTCKEELRRFVWRFSRLGIKYRGGNVILQYGNMNANIVFGCCLSVQQCPNVPELRKDKCCHYQPRKGDLNTL